MKATKAEIWYLMVFKLFSTTDLRKAKNSSNNVPERLLNLTSGKVRFPGPMINLQWSSFSSFEEGVNDRFWPYWQKTPISQDTGFNIQAKKASNHNVGTCKTGPCNRRSGWSSTFSWARPEWPGLPESPPTVLYKEAGEEAAPMGRHKPRKICFTLSHLVEESWNKTGQRALTKRRNHLPQNSYTEMYRGSWRSYQQQSLQFLKHFSGRRMTFDKKWGLGPIFGSPGFAQTFPKWELSCMSNAGSGYYASGLKAVGHRSVSCSHQEIPRRSAVNNFFLPKTCSLESPPSVSYAF